MILSWDYYAPQQTNFHKIKREKYSKTAAERREEKGRRRERNQRETWNVSCCIESKKAGSGGVSASQ